MKIAIVGAGQVGGALAKAFVGAGHVVYICNRRGADSLKGLAESTGAIAASPLDAVKGANVIVIAIPFVAVAALPSDFLSEAASSAVVIDATNYYPRRDGAIGDVDNGMAESRWVAKQINHSVVKAFNNIFYKHLVSKARPMGDGERAALAIAGDDEEAKALVGELINQIGFDVVDAGLLDDSWRQQPGTPVYGAGPGTSKVLELLAEATPEFGRKWRAQN